MLDETLGNIHFWMLFMGFHTTFLVQHWLSVECVARRIANYLPSDDFTGPQPDFLRPCVPPRRTHAAVPGTSGNPQGATGEHR